MTPSEQVKSINDFLLALIIFISLHIHHERTGEEGNMEKWMTACQPVTRKWIKQLHIIRYNYYNLI